MQCNEKNPTYFYKKCNFEHTVKISSESVEFCLRYELGRVENYSFSKLNEKI